MIGNRCVARVVILSSPLFLGREILLDHSWVNVVLPFFDLLVAGYKLMVNPASRLTIECQIVMVSMAAVSSMAGSSPPAMDFKVCLLCRSSSLSSCSDSLSQMSIVGFSLWFLFLEGFPMNLR